MSYDAKRLESMLQIRIDTSSLGHSSRRRTMILAAVSGVLFITGILCIVISVVYLKGYVLSLPSLTPEHLASPEDVSGMQPGHVRQSLWKNINDNDQTQSQSWKGNPGERQHTASIQDFGKQTQSIQNLSSVNQELTKSVVIKSTPSYETVTTFVVNEQNNPKLDHHRNIEIQLNDKAVLAGDRQWMPEYHLSPTVAAGEQRRLSKSRKRLLVELNPRDKKVERPSSPIPLHLNIDETPAHGKKRRRQRYNHSKLLTRSRSSDQQKAIRERQSTDEVDEVKARESDASYGENVSNLKTRRRLRAKREEIPKEKERVLLNKLLDSVMPSSERNERKMSISDVDNLLGLGNSNKNTTDGSDQKWRVELNAEQRMFVFIVVMIAVGVAVATIIFAACWCLLDSDSLCPRKCREKCCGTPADTFSPQRWWMEALAQRVENLEAGQPLMEKRGRRDKDRKSRKKKKKNNENDAKESKDDTKTGDAETVGKEMKPDAAAVPATSQTEAAAVPPDQQQVQGTDASKATPANENISANK